VAKSRFIEWDIALFAFLLYNYLLPLQAHKWVNVESTLKACYVGPLVAPSPTTQRKNSANIVMNNMAFRKDSLSVTSTLVFAEGESGKGRNKETERGKIILACLNDFWVELW